MTSANDFIQYSILPINLNTNILNELWELRPSEPNKITMYGKTIDTPRRFKVYGKTYKFNGMAEEAEETIPDLVLPYLNIINIMDNGYNSVLINWYEDGGEYIGYHSDKTDHLVPDSNIYGVSFGSERIMRFKNKEDATTIDFKLENNSIINMMGGCQSVFQHSIVQTKKVCGKRISLTFRKVIMTRDERLNYAIRLSKRSSNENKTASKIDELKTGDVLNTPNYLKVYGDFITVTGLTPKMISFYFNPDTKIIDGVKLPVKLNRAPGVRPGRYMKILKTSITDFKKIQPLDI